jgi:hypothetical protein
MISFACFCLVQGYLRPDIKPLFYKRLTSLLFGEQQKQYYKILSERLKAA